MRKETQPYQHELRNKSRSPWNYCSILSISNALWHEKKWNRRPLVEHAALQEEESISCDNKWGKKEVWRQKLETHFCYGHPVCTEGISLSRKINNSK
ncbi:uncharacterized protein LOC143274021 isoform X2 [Peromyscus maniculatus bairdii]|uniref:uncharacterized protein LOC143274021 isoform X2 n=1 Tax=Peromyscus maniculatus bairdii TaxID=230844 RepID=UPI003FD31830